MGNTSFGISFLSALNALKDIDAVAEADSISCPGKKACLSGPIPKLLYKDFDAFFNDIATHFQTPILPTDIHIISELKFMESGPNSSECKVWLNGRRMKDFQRQDHDKDVLAFWAKTRIDPKKKTITLVQWDEDHTWVRTVNVVFHCDQQNESVRMEYWIETSDGTRDASQFWCDAMRDQYLKAAAFLRVFSKVQVNCLEPSPDKPERKICLTADLGEYFDSPETLLQAWVAYLKEENLTLQGTVEHGDEGEEVTMLLELKIPQAEGQEPKSVMLSKKLSVDAENWHASLDIFAGKELEYVTTERYQVYTEPLRLGAWTYRPAEHNGGFEVELGHHFDQAQFVLRLNKLLKEREAGKEVESLDQKDFFF